MANGVPRVPRDLQDHKCDCETDEGVRDLSSQSNRRSARDDAERNQAIDARVVAVGDECRAVQLPTRTEAHLRCDLIAKESEEACECEWPEVFDVFGIDETFDRLPQGHTSGYEDREHNRVSGPALCSGGTEQEGDANGYGGQRIADVVDEVGKESHTPGEQIDGGLRDRSCAQDGKADEDRSQAMARPHYRSVDDPVRMAVGVAMRM